MPGLVDLVPVRLDVRRDLDTQRCGEHLPGTIAGELVKQRPTNRRRGVHVGLGLFLSYL